MAGAPDSYDNLPGDDNADDINDSFNEDDLVGDERLCYTETENIFKAFLITRLTSEMDKETNGDMNVADISDNVLRNIRTERENFEKSKKSLDNLKVIELGKSLANTGDEINKRFHGEFTTMFGKLNLQEEFAFNTFRKIARCIFEKGINWGRILALFYFGFELTMWFIRKGVHLRGFLKKILSFMVNFLWKESIVKWIIDQGGWIKFKLQEDDMLWTKRICGVFVAIAVAYGVYKMVQKKN